MKSFDTTFSILTFKKISFQYGKSDIGSANLFITEERAKHVDYTKPYASDSACFFLRKPPPLPKWRDMIVLFQNETWLATLATFICAIVFLMVTYAILDPSKVFSVPIWMIAVAFDESIPFIQRIKYVFSFLKCFLP